jgi:hypothetical protein
VVVGVVVPTGVDDTEVGVALIVVTETLRIGAPKSTFPEVNLVVKLC